MGRTAKHNWAKLFLEYCQGKYKSARQFADKKKLNYDQVKKEFKKLRDQEQNGAENGGQNGAENGGKIPPENGGKKGQKKEAKKPSPKEKGQNPHPWQTLKQQFTDWPEEKLQAYLLQLEARLAELGATPFEDLTAAEVKELGQLRRERRAILSDPDPELICGARNRDGSPCGNPAERGKKVCWNHGGAPGSGTRPGQQHNLRHGLYAKILPDCDEFREIVADIEQANPLDMTWHDIVMIQAQIAWSHKVMFVASKQEMIKELKKIKVQNEVNEIKRGPNAGKLRTAEVFREEEWNFQFAWDRQATNLKALSVAMQTYDKLIARYESQIENAERRGLVIEEHRLRLEKLKHDMEISRERLELEKQRADKEGETGDILDEALDDEGLADDG